MNDIVEIKERIIQAGFDAVEELIVVAKEKIIGNGEEDISADRLKNAAATKKLAIFDAFEILKKIEEERDYLEQAGGETSKVDSKQGFAERNANSNGKK